MVGLQCLLQGQLIWPMAGNSPDVVIPFQRELSAILQSEIWVLFPLFSPFWGAPKTSIKIQFQWIADAAIEDGCLHDPHFDPWCIAPPQFGL